MRIAVVLVGLFALSAALPAAAKTSWSKCIDATDPSECIARRALHIRDAEHQEILEIVLRHGLVDVVPAKSRLLLSGMHESIENDLEDSAEAKLLHSAPQDSLVAAMALVAAARHEADPFSNSIYRKL